MKLIINILIFSILSSVLLAKPLKLSQDDLLEVSTVGDRPIAVSVNFEVSDVKLIVKEEGTVSLEILRKGFVLIPKVEKYNATIILIAKDGGAYSISMSGGGTRKILRLVDATQAYNSKNSKKIKFQSGQMDNDARNIIKTILLGKTLTGFSKEKAYQKINAKQYSLSRIERYVGGKYIVDRWTIENHSGKSLYFLEEDFYTKGVLAVAIEKNRLNANERIFLITILNKASLAKDLEE